MQKTIALNYSEQNKQLGGAAFYGFRWNDKNTSNITLSYSLLKTEGIIRKKQKEQQVTRYSLS